MHELSLCASIAGIVRDYAAGRPVQRVRVRVGHLRQVVPDTLVHCWDLVVDGTDLDGTTLEVEGVPLTLDCGDCGTRTVPDRLVMRCASCGGPHVSVVAGDEFLVTSLDVVEV